MEPTGKRKPRILILDLETIPNLPEALKVWTQLSDFPGRTLKATISTIICFGYKVVGEGEAKCLNAWDYPNWLTNVNDDSRLVRDAARIIKTADVIVFQNGKRFDWKFLQTRLLINGLSPLPSILSVDTKNEAKKHLLAFSNSLKHLASQFTDAEKMENEGWDLWVKVHGRDKFAQDVMSTYCKHDILATEAVFNALRPLIKTLPNMNQFKLEENVCPNCGGHDLRRRGMRLLKERMVQRFKCFGCGAWSNNTVKSLTPKSQE